MATDHDQLVQARAMWREELQKRAKLHTDWFDRSTFHLQDNTLSPTLSPRGDFDPELLNDYSDSRHLSFNKCNGGSRLHHEQTYNETEKQIVECDKAKLADTPGHSERDFDTFQSSQILQDHDDEDDWLQETEELDGYPTAGIMVNEEDVSFSDLEEDSDWTLPMKSK